MKRILFYVSDHGFGHATRIIALVRFLKKRNPNYQIVVKNLNAYEFLRNSLPEGVLVEKIQTDVGPQFNWKNFCVDMNKTIKSYNDWIKQESSWIQKESKCAKNSDLVVSDISPISQRLAKKVDVPSVVIANFSWIDILEKLNGYNMTGILEWLYNSEEYSSLTIEPPFSMKLKGFSNKKKCSLLCRGLTMTRDQVFHELKIKSHPIVIYLPEGMSNLVKNTEYVSLGKKSIEVNGITRESMPEAQNIIANSVAVISKAGHSILSECAKYRVPMFLVPRNDYPEDKILCKKAQEFGLCNILSFTNIKNGLDISDYKNKISKIKNRINYNKLERLERHPHAGTLIEEFLK